MKSFEAANSIESFDGIDKLYLRDKIEDTIIAQVCSPDDGLECIQAWRRDNLEHYHLTFESEFTNIEEMVMEWRKDPTALVDKMMERLGVWEYRPEKNLDKAA